MKWQPIETAPKDRWILVYVPGAAVPCSAIWSEIDNSFTTCEECANEFRAYGTEWSFAPAYWAPLPEPPEQQN